MSACKYGALATPATEAMTSREAAKHLGMSKSAIGDHRRGECSCHSGTAVALPAGESETHNPDGTASYTRYSAEPWGYEDYRAFIASRGQDPDAVTFAWGWTSNPAGGFWNKLNNVRPKPAKDDGAPAWPVIQPAEPVVFRVINRQPQPVRDKKLALKCADTQIGFRRLADGTLDPFHDDAAIAVFIQAAIQLQPDKIQILGDFLDLASQGRFAQEAAFAQTTQPAIDRGHRLLATLRAVCPDAEIVLVEGNHDKRMQNFIEANALAAFGLKRANMPDEWPAMSLPHLTRTGWRSRTTQ